MEKSSVKKLLRDQGMCGDLSPDGQRACLKEPGHSTAHGWDDTRKLLDQLSVLLSRTIDDFGDLDPGEVQLVARMAFPYD